MNLWVDLILILFREKIYSDVLELLVNSRRKAFTEIMDLRSKFHLSMDEEEKTAKSEQIKLLSLLQTSNEELKNLLIKQKVFNYMSLNKVESRMRKDLDRVTKTKDDYQKSQVSNRVSSELKNTLILQQKAALKRQLANLDTEYNSLKIELDKEVKNRILLNEVLKLNRFVLKLKQKEAKEHELHQKLKNDRNLESAKKSNVEKLVFDHK